MSGQLDERLRMAAQTYRRLGRPVAEQLLLESADTISELREELAKWERLTAGIDLPEYPVSQFVSKDLERENAELREMARHLYACLSFCDREDEERGCVLCPYQSASEDCEFEQRLLELGVEVYA